MIDSEFRSLRRRQLDNFFRTPHFLKALPKTKLGYLADIRSALGMSLTQLARRLKTTASTVSRAEERERDGSITLGTLQRIAEAMDCELVYAIVPKTSLSEIVNKQAAKAASLILDRVTHSMRLEDQEVDGEELNRLIDDTIEELIRTGDKRIWDAIIRHSF